ncbi:MAG: repressor LexA [Oscillospiraceae bacterium]|nr:repressor LexA [Oscillospiraceae bacterium]MBQ4312514.1 repressor LexA [Oscillospiraceae bacterium]MCR5167497.1 transcriptional repressor LexA [Oscillospiraceae bacterium]
MKENEKKVYEYILSRLDEGISPSIREICSALDIRSTSTASRYVNTLVEEGLLEKEDGLNRSLRPAGASSVRIPVAGQITAGQPITAIENITDHIIFQPDRKYSGKLFALNVRGTSMINAGILDGDIVVVEQCSAVDNGEIAAVLVEGESATIKRFYKEKGHYRLQPENDTMSPIYTDDCSILGRVVAVIRYL